MIALVEQVTARGRNAYAAVRNFARRRPGLYAAIRLVKYGPFLGWRDNRMRRRLLAEGREQGWRMLNLGSGGRYEPAALNLDVTPTTGPDVVADGYALPFASGALRLIVCDYVIEHVPDPHRFLASIHAALSVDGVAYFAVPFLQPMHGAPGDYTRWTREGFRRAAERAGFDIVRCGPHAGAAYSVFWVLKEFLALVLGLGIRPAVAVFRYLLAWALCPLLILDALLPPVFRSEALASGFWFVLTPHRNAGTAGMRA